MSCAVNLGDRGKRKLLRSEEKKRESFHVRERKRLKINVRGRKKKQQQEVIKLELS
jgi:hypothetical protein